MRRVAAGDKRACRTLLDRYLAPTWRMALAFAGRADIADDLTQEAMARLWLAAPKWKPKAHLSTWLYRVVKNLWIDQLRKERPDQPGPDSLLDLADDRPDQQEQYEALEASATLEQAIAHLPARQRVAITLYYFDGLSIDEGAGVMDIGADAFQSLIARARKGLKQLLQDQQQDLMEGIGHG